MLPRASTLAPAASNLSNLNPPNRPCITEERRRNPDRRLKYSQAGVYSLLSLIQKGTPKVRGAGEGRNTRGNNGARETRGPMENQQTRVQRPPRARGSIQGTMARGSIDRQARRSGQR